MEKNQAAETERMFCSHDIGHAMDVARIAYIINLEESLGFSQEVIYAAALLHDITKWQQHVAGVPHNESAIEPATQILRDCQFAEEEIALICQAILHHRREPVDGEAAFSRLIFRADKLSRACYCCHSRDTCHWEQDKQNKTLHY